MTIAAILLAAATLLTADDYVFSRPANTGCVHGVVMGDAGDYGVMRYEDILWLNEALAERYAMTTVSTSGELSNLVETASGRVGGLAIDANALLLSGMLTGNYVVGDPETSQPKLIYRTASAGSPVLTNIYERTVYDFPTNTVTYPVIVMRQTMTNGTVNVYTNRFQPNRSIWPYALTNHVETVTGVYSAVDFIYDRTPTNVHDLTDRELYMHGTVRPLFGAYSKATITNLFGYVRLMRKTIPMRAEHVGAQTNNAVETTWSWNSDDDTDKVTNRMTFAMAPKASITRSFSEYQHQSKNESGEWEGYTTTYESRSKSVTKPGNATRPYATSVADLAVTYKTDTPRISSALAFVHFSGLYKLSSTYNASGSPSKYTNEEYRAECIMPLGTCDRIAGNDKLTFGVRYSGSDAIDAADFMSIPFVDELYPMPGLPTGPDPVWEYNEDRDSRWRSKSCEVHVTFYLEIEDVYLILITNPKTKLQSWSEYE